MSRDDVNGPLTLRQLVDEPSLRLSVVEPGNLDALVRAAHSIEIEDAARWLRPGSIMLTTGLRFSAVAVSDADQARLIDQLVEAEVAALLFGVGVHFDEVPSGLRAAARARGFAIISVSAGVPFSAIEDYVNRGALSAETYLLKRTVWLQNDVLQALSAADPISALVVRLGTLTKGAAVLYEHTGRIVASTGHGPLRLMWDEISARDAAPQRFSVGQWAVVSRPFFLKGSPFRLAIASRSASLLHDLGPDLLETAERVLAAASAVRSLAMSQERAEAERIVSALRAGISSSRVRQTWDRLRPFRFTVGRDLRVVAMSAIDGGLDDNRASETDALLEEAQLEDLPLVLSREYDHGDAGTQLTAVIADGAAADAWCDVVGRTHIAGVSGPFNDLTVAPQYFQEAGTAWQLAGRRRERGGSDTIVRLDEVDFATWLLTRRDDAQIAARFDRHFSALAAAPDLAETVVIYLASHQDVKNTAAALFVHPNTVRYRLRRVEQLVGGSISSARIVANLYLAFQDEILARTTDS